MAAPWGPRSALCLAGLPPLGFQGTAPHTDLSPSLAVCLPASLAPSLGCTKEIPEAPPACLGPPPPSPLLSTCPLPNAQGLQLRCGSERPTHGFHSARSTRPGAAHAFVLPSGRVLRGHTARSSDGKPLLLPRRIQPCGNPESSAPSHSCPLSAPDLAVPPQGGGGEATAFLPRGRGGYF